MKSVSEEYTGGVKNRGVGGTEKQGLAGPLGTRLAGPYAGWKCRSEMTYLSLEQGCKQGVALTPLFR